MKMRQFNLNYLQIPHIYRVYKENNDLVISFVANRETRYIDLTTEEMERLINAIKEKGRSMRYNVEVYNGLDEAKNH